MSGTDPTSRAWLDKAGNDLLNIRNNLGAPQTPWDTVCFHAQQAAEKALKAFLIARGEAPPRSHDLVFLLSRCATHDESLEAFADGCEQLTYFGVHVRYPGDVYDPGEDDARRLARIAEDLVESIRARLEP
jgi:HEPN domain-containing protein